MERTRVWEAWIGAEFRALYFADLDSAFTRRQQWATGITLLGSSGAVLTALGNLPPQLAWLKVAAPLLLAAVSIYSVVAQNQRRAAEAGQLHVRWSKLATRFEALWGDMYATDAPERLSKALEEEAEVSGLGANFPYDEKRLTRWFDLVIQQHQHRLQAA